MAEESSAAPQEDVEVERELTTARAEGGAWRAWLDRMLREERGRAGAAVLALILGFVAGLLALYGFGHIAEDVMGQETMRLDNGVLLELHQFASPRLDLAARAVSTLGSEGVAAFVLLLLIWFGFQRRWGAAISLILVTGGAQILNDILKSIFHRTRPAPVIGIIPGQSFSFPSGHAMVSMAFYLFLAYLGWQVLRGWRRGLWVDAMILLVVLIGLARLYLGVHYFTDVVAGYLAGFIWTDAVILGGRLLPRVRPRHHAASQTGPGARPAARASPRGSLS